MTPHETRDLRREIYIFLMGGHFLQRAQPGNTHYTERGSINSQYKKSSERVVCVHFGLRKVSKWTTQRQGEVSLELKQIGLYPACTLLPYGS